MLLFVGTLAGVAGYPDYQSDIPNGKNVMKGGAAWGGVGHLVPGGGGARNPYGLAWAAAGHLWTPTFCGLDSDGDGQTNGFELGDPDCTWTKGGTPKRACEISHSGYADSGVSRDVLFW